MALLNDMNLELGVKGLKKNGVMPEPERAKKVYGLTYKKYLFCKYYHETQNATRAAEMAGYKGTSRTALGVKGSKLLDEKGVSDYLTHLESIHEAKMAKNGIYSLSMTEVFDMYVDLAQSTENDSVKRAALADMTKILGGFAPKEVNITQDINISNQLQEARQRQIEYAHKRLAMNTIDVKAREC